MKSGVDRDLIANAEMESVRGCLSRQFVNYADSHKNKTVLLLWPLLTIPDFKETYDGLKL